MNLNIDPNSILRLGESSLNQNSVINVCGANNLIEIGDNVKGTLIINVVGDNSRIIIGCGVLVIGALEVVIQRGNSQVIVGENSTFMGLVRLYNHEPSYIVAGADCMFASDIIVMTSDIHPIYDPNNVRINHPLPITIGDHVWIGETVRILKGVTIGSGSIIGMSSMVTRGVYPEQCVIAGNPAKVVREGVHWARDLP